MNPIDSVKPATQPHMVKQVLEIYKLAYGVKSAFVNIALNHFSKGKTMTHEIKMLASLGLFKIYDEIHRDSIKNAD